MRKSHVRCEWGEKLEIISKAYLSILEFGIIPKLETMSLIESIEEESTEETTENSAIEEIQDNEIMPISENNNTEENNSISKVILFGGVAILVIGIVCTIMLKRKK